MSLRQRSLAAGVVRAAMIATAALALASCTRGMADLEQRVTEMKARKGPPLEPIPVMRNFETFEYTAQNLRDPFSPSQTEDGQANANGPRPPTEHVKEALEAYPLDSLDMVGTLGLSKQITGLVKDPDGVIHRVKVDNFVGQNYGRITGIFEDRIELVELVPNGVGGWIERPATIALESK